MVRTLNPVSISFLELFKKEVPPDKKIAFVSGVFNIVHPGHMRLLRFASECADFVVVGVKDDAADGVIVPLADRIESVLDTALVNYAIPLYDPTDLFIMTLKPDFVVKGKEHDQRENKELEVCNSYGGKLIFCSGECTFTFNEKLKREYGIITGSKEKYKIPSVFLKRHKSSENRLSDILERMANLKVMVIGDTIVDEYTDCDPVGMSQEDSTIVVSPNTSEKFIGGAAIVAAHSRSLGASVNFYSVLGQDENYHWAENKLEEFGVKTLLIPDQSRMTTLKQRFKVQGKTLLRVNRVRSHEIDESIQEQFLSHIETEIENTNLVIFSDFSYGCLPLRLIQKISQLCKRRKVMMAGDSQSSSQIGDITRFSGMDIITPTEREARLAINDFKSGITIVAEKVREITQARNVVITLGGEGILLHLDSQSRPEWLTDKLPAINQNPVDISGAGDSFLATASMSLAVGGSIWESSAIGSIAAACQVSRKGNIPLTANEIQKNFTGRRADHQFGEAQRY